VPAFVANAIRIMKQTDVAPGILGWSWGVDLFKLEFHTLLVWEDADSLRDIVRVGSHRTAREAFEQGMRRKSILVYYKAFGRDLPLTWKDAIARQQTCAPVESRSQLTRREGLDSLGRQRKLRRLRRWHSVVAAGLLEPLVPRVGGPSKRCTAPPKSAPDE